MGSGSGNVEKCQEVEGMAQEATESASAKATDASRTWKSRAREPDHGAVLRCGSLRRRGHGLGSSTSRPASSTDSVGLRFRTLAVASAQVKSKTENLARALQSGESTTNSADYFSKLVSDLQLLAEAKPPADVAALQLAGGGQRAIAAWQDVVRPAAAVSLREFDDLDSLRGQTARHCGSASRRQHESAT